MDFYFLNILSYDFFIIAYAFDPYELVFFFHVFFQMISKSSSSLPCGIRAI